eukprot:PhM_4_TR4932/c0_g1_i1/m.79775
MITIYTDPNLGQYVTRGWDLSKFVSGKIRTLSGETFTVPIAAGKDVISTVKDLKKAIEDVRGIPIDRQTLRTTARIVYESELLSDIFSSGGGGTLILITSYHPSAGPLTHDPNQRPEHLGGGCAPREPSKYVTQTMTEAAPSSSKGPVNTNATKSTAASKNKDVKSVSEQPVDRSKVLAAALARQRKK